MTARRPRNRRSGALHVIAGLLIASAIVRMGGQNSFATANEAGPPESELAATSPAQPDALLAALQSRETRLAEREAQLLDRMQALRIAEDEITEKLDALRAAEDELSATIALADQAAASDLGQLTTVYESMKPKEAAALFAEMQPGFAAGFLGLMRPDAAAQIMSQLDPETAYAFSVVLAGRNANTPTE